MIKKKYMIKNKTFGGFGVILGVLGFFLYWFGLGSLDVGWDTIGWWSLVFAFTFAILAIILGSMQLKRTEKEVGKWSLIIGIMDIFIFIVAVSRFLIIIIKKLFS